MFGIIGARASGRGEIPIAKNEIIGVLRAERVHLRDDACGIVTNVVMLLRGAVSAIF